MFGLKKKYAKTWEERRGRKLPVIERQAEPLIWIHAVSVGEVRAAAPLIQELRSRYPSMHYVISCITETGLAAAKKFYTDAAACFVLPHLAWGACETLMAAWHPDLLLFVETDFWPQLLRAAQRHQVPTAVINAKVSERSARRLKRFGWLLFGSMLQNIDRWAVQAEVYLERFKSVGIDPARMRVTGNIKMDQELRHLGVAEKHALRKRLGIAEGARVLVAGSTHEGEEELLLSVFKELQPRFPDLHLLIVPRHPQRFDIVARLIETHGLQGSRSSSAVIGSDAVTLVDEMGVLCDCYQLAACAVVCGSFTPAVGGHNILEPSAYGVPVICGPYMKTQPVLIDMLHASGCGFQVEGEKLAETITSIVENKELAAQLGTAGERLLEGMRGAVLSTVDQLPLEKVEQSLR